MQHAYKYLSDSQLNSFGLAVFLASAAHFNEQCRFVILDDVINSFDSYKRPQVIELLKGEFTDHQILLLTHDRFWRDLLHRRLPTWQRVDFISYAFGVGPTVAPAQDSLEQVKEAIRRDEADQAGQMLARYLEDVLRELCEAFEVEVKFSRRGEYTLETLLDRLKVRVQEKLKGSHPLAAALEEMRCDNAYRNWTIHCKDPESPIHPHEIDGVVKRWESIDGLVRCPKCNEFARYQEKNQFRCACGLTQLART